MGGLVDVSIRVKYNSCAIFYNNVDGTIRTGLLYYSTILYHNIQHVNTSIKHFGDNMTNYFEQYPQV